MELLFVFAMILIKLSSLPISMVNRIGKTFNKFSLSHHRTYGSVYGGLIKFQFMSY